MFVKLQHSDTNCLCIFNSTKTTPLNLGISFSPPINKSNDKIKHKQQKQILECPSGAQIPKKNGLVKVPRGTIEKEVKLGCSFVARGGVFNGVIERGNVNRDGLLDTLDETVEENGGFEGILISAGGVNGLPPKNGVYSKEKLRPNGNLKKLGGINENYGKSKGKTRVEGMQTTCSTKWARYGGCVPAMLEAVETINDLDEALKPWETTLTNKERSILLKEQLGWERAMAIFQWFKRKGCYEVNVIHYNIMFRILGKARKWSEVEMLWGEMWKRGIKPVNSTYGTLIDVYSKGGLREKAMKWLDLMNDDKLEPDEVTMGIVVQMYKKAGDFKTAEEFFKKWSCSKHGKAISRGKTGVNVGDFSENVCLSTYTYNTLIDTYGKAGKFQEASETFERMLQKGIMPTTVTFNTMIHMFGNNGQLDKVVSLMQRMKEAKCSPDTRTYNILISLHAKHSNIELAARYWTKMKEASLEPDAVSYRTLLYAFSIRHMVDEAEKLVSEMDKRKLEIDEFTQSSLTRMYIEAGLIDKSWSWFERFHFSGQMTSECYSANIDAYGERGYILQAEQVFNCCLKVKKLTVLEFNVMIKAYGISKKFEKACGLFDTMGKHGLVPDRCSYNSLVQMLASGDIPEKATFYLRKMQEVGLVNNDCSPYCAVISSYAKLGCTGLAVGLYNEMIGHGVKPDVIVYGVLINAFAETGSVNEATCYVNTMRNLGLPMNAVVCKSLIKLYTKVGYLKEAQEAYKMLQGFEAGLDVYSSNCMIDLYSERSMVFEAEEIFESLRENGDANEFTYAMMLCMYKRNGRFVEAIRIARKMRELGLMTDLLSYNLVLGLYASDGRYKEAVATFDEMMESLMIKPDDSTFKSLGIILLKCGIPKVAVEKLELTRKKDAESGLRMWASTLSSVIDMDDDDDDDGDDDLIADDV
ncbi:pentatricopeptide repeat-containing protein at3g23020 [Phtheirospermum japonicum]|uniref:Pentatricopeptide repeat-containing protein at3g23020 n=1 Tax=Phtheirospermum japonicum TaxID=374723 RepID=A0A830BML0_9LAMI|nr:pentatricopeptide repeat-containing protein at3g23020 [Phtheirospermum japonicum]